jgi:hypothetical protein
MSEADRVAKQKLADSRAAEVAESQRKARQDAADRAALYREVNQLVAEILPLVEKQGFASAEPITVRTPRFPPLGDLFGDHTTIEGGWRLGEYGAQSLELLGDGRICNEGRPSQLADIDWCVL